MTRVSSNPGDGSDPLGRALDISITIAADGTVHLHDITRDLLPVLAALNPNDETTRRRLEAARRLTREQQP